MKKYLQFYLSLILTFLLFSISLPPVGYAQTSAQRQISPELLKSLQKIEERVEKRRVELGIPGIALVIVKDGGIIFMKGFGYKDFERKIPVTPDTQFAIGSASKAFTALSVLMSADEGKISLDDNPRKYLPYFRMKDAETEKNITVRDLLAHSSGLNRTDLAMLTGRLNRQELIRVAGEAQPMAKLREKFLYQNIMYAAAGEVVAQVQKMPWEKFVVERIFKPLGMNNSTMTVREMQMAKDYSFGYEYNFETKQTRRLPFREIPEVAPAGSINSSARDMAKWITFVINGGETDGKRLVSEKGFEEWMKNQIKVTPDGKTSYGLGWFLRQWNGLKVVEHGGNIDGFNSLVAMIPEKKLGFVMLTNVTGSSLGNELMPLIWENILESSNPPQDISVEAMQKEVGKYRFEAAGFDVEIKIEDGKLVAIVPNQPTYTLENVGGRRYKLKEIEGFFITFRDNSIYLEQPQGNYSLPKVGAEQKAQTSEAAKELVGKYLAPGGSGTVEIKSEPDGKVTLNIIGQMPYTLSDKAEDEFFLSPLPDSYFLRVKRDAGNKIVSITIVQPEGEFEFQKTDEKPDEKPQITADELMSKVIEATGGEANWRKIKSRLSEYEVDFVHQGVRGVSKTYEKSPNKYASEITFSALGKIIGKTFTFFDGIQGEEIHTFLPVEKFAGKRLEDMRINSDFYWLLNRKKNFQKVEILGTEKVGDEECYVVELTPAKGTKVTELYSTRTFLLLKRRGVIPSGTREISLPYSMTFSDYREVNGIKLPFRIVNSTPSMGEVVSVLKSVQHNVPINDRIFAPRRLLLK